MGPPFEATAIILAGGRSTRLGFDKQLIKLGDGNLMDHLINTLSLIFEEIIIVSNKPELYAGKNVKVVSDSFVDVGPLAGFYAGLSAATHTCCYVTACDMPWISESYVRYLMKCHKDQPDKEIWTTRKGTMLEPFGGLYSKVLTDRIVSLVTAGNRRIQALFLQAEVGYVSEKKARHYSPDWHMFDNINTLNDLETFKSQLGEGEKLVQSTGNHALGE
jgi:molybdopterin-guanine dinucleotide biosynthesis protein A